MKPVNEIAIIILFLLGIGLAIIETVIPGMIVGIIGYILIAVSVYKAFDQVGNLFGFGLILFAILVLPYFILKGFRRLQLKKSIVSSTNFSLDHLINQEGITLSPLRPIGKAEIKNQVFNVYSESTIQINSGERVIVSKIEGNKIMVRSIS